jgi:hypothetical protein
MDSGMYVVTGPMFKPTLYLASAEDQAIVARVEEMIRSNLGWENSYLELGFSQFFSGAGGSVVG